MYKNGETLKMLMEMFCQKLIVSNVILAILDHLKPNIFFVGQPWLVDIECHPFSKSLYPTLSRICVRVDSVLEFVLLFYSWFRIVNFKRIITPWCPLMNIATSSW